MERYDFVVLGAGISGLSFAGAIVDEHARARRPRPTVLVLERDGEIGGYCKTIVKEGFVWDYSGHFFHFRHPEIERWLVERMAKDSVRTVVKRSFVRYRGKDVDFPFQKNIHQLEKDELIECLHDLVFKDESAPVDDKSFRAMLMRKFGRAICEKFLFPYNEKLYATDLATLDEDAMGRFFPHADLKEIVRNMKTPDNATYNATFTYPKGGAIEYVRALRTAVPDDAVRTSCAATAIDRAAHVVTTTAGERIGYGALVSSAPLPALLRATGTAFPDDAFSWNRVLVFNLGFDAKGPRGVHWTYFPDRARRFYRVGFYDNIQDDDRMSLYVEIGMPKTGAVDVETERARVLDDLRAEGIVTTQKLVAHHHVVMDPAYVHITKRSLALVDEHRRALAQDDIHTVGRYGGWTYCSIEDNIVETRALAARLSSTT